MRARGRRRGLGSVVFVYDFAFFSPLGLLLQNAVDPARELGLVRKLLLIVQHKRMRHRLLRSGPLGRFSHQASKEQKEHRKK